MTFLVLSLIIIVAYQNEENYFIFLESRKIFKELAKHLYIKPYLESRKTVSSLTNKFFYGDLYKHRK